MLLSVLAVANCLPRTRTTRCIFLGKEMEFLENRLASFKVRGKPWPYRNNSNKNLGPASLCNLGFYRQDMGVVCSACSLSITDWSPYTNPMEYHYHNNPCYLAQVWACSLLGEQMNPLPLLEQSFTSNWHNDVTPNQVFYLSRWLLLGFCSRLLLLDLITACVHSVICHWMAGKHLMIQCIASY
jgi:hypothetical protein